MAQPATWQRVTTEAAEKIRSRAKGHSFSSVKCRRGEELVCFLWSMEGSDVSPTLFGFCV